jgi:hypothetical protein
MPFTKRKLIVKKYNPRPGMVVPICDSTYSGGGDWVDHSSRKPRQKAGERL